MDKMTVGVYDVDILCVYEYTPKSIDTEELLVIHEAYVDEHDVIHFYKLMECASENLLEMIKEI